MIGDVDATAVVADDHMGAVTFPPLTKALRHSLPRHWLLCVIATQTLPIGHKLLMTKATMTSGP